MQNNPVANTVGDVILIDESSHTNSCEIDPEYDKFVRELASRRDPRTFSNKSCAHALSILRCIFDTAEKEVDIFSGFLDPHVYNDEDLLRRAIKFISEKKGEVRILLQSGVSADRVNNISDFLNLASKYQDNCKVKIINDAHGFKNSETHFLVADNSAYRIELDVDQHTAICSFEDKAFASQLSGIFNEAWKAKVSDLPVPQQN